MPVQRTRELVSGGTGRGQLLAGGAETQAQAPVCQQTNRTQAGQNGREMRRVQNVGEKRTGKQMEMVSPPNETIDTSNCTAGQ